MDLRQLISMRSLRHASLLLLFAALTLPALAVDPVYTSTFSNVALKGYDAVAYFQDSAATEGKKSFSHEWNGAEWRFVNAANRDLFAKAPEKYAPQYGGYCAYAASQGSIASGDPKVWKVWQGKLYLNYSKGVSKKWLVDIPGHVAAADKNWPELLAD